MTVRLAVGAVEGRIIGEADLFGNDGRHLPAFDHLTGHHHAFAVDIPEDRNAVVPLKGTAKIKFADVKFARDGIKRERLGNVRIDVANDPGTKRLLPPLPT